MGYLWSPWRFHYSASARRESGCIFCHLVSEKADHRNLILLRRNHHFLVLNEFPYTTGHLTVVPLRELSRLANSSAAELEGAIRLARDWEGILQKTCKPR